MEKLDCVVIGAGVIGLAVARALARAPRESETRRLPATAR